MSWPSLQLSTKKISKIIVNCVPFILEIKKTVFIIRTFIEHIESCHNESRKIGKFSVEKAPRDCTLGLIVIKSCSSINMLVLKLSNCVNFWPYAPYSYEVTCSFSPTSAYHTFLYSIREGANLSPNKFGLLWKKYGFVSGGSKGNFLLVYISCQTEVLPHFAWGTYFNFSGFFFMQVFIVSSLDKSFGVNELLLAFIRSKNSINWFFYNYKELDKFDIVSKDRIA